MSYTLTRDPVTLYACHCTDCQTISGASFDLTMIVHAEAVVLSSGEAERYDVHFPDGRRWQNARCPECGTNLWGISSRAPSLLNLRPGTLHDTSWVIPVAHIWTRSAQPWIQIPKDDLIYPKQPEDIMPLVIAWKNRAGG